MKTMLWVMYATAFCCVWFLIFKNELDFWYRYHCWQQKRDERRTAITCTGALGVIIALLTAFV